MPSSIALLLVLSAFAIAIAGATLFSVTLVCIGALLWEGITVWAASSSP